MQILAQQASIASSFLAQLRDVSIQQDRLRFRKNLERLGEIMAYEISKTLDYKSQTVKTPLGEKSVQALVSQPVLITILRAGLPFYQGLLNYFDAAESGFVGAYRAEGEHQLKINTEYIGAPSLEGKTLILADPMLATGKSLCEAYQHLCRKNGAPKRLIVASVIGSHVGVEHLKRELPNAEIWIGDIDEGLNELSYIVPGLGDAGDLCFGEKL